MAHIYNSQLDAFDLYHKFQESTSTSKSPASDSALPALGHAIAGSSGAAISNLASYPLALIITRLQVQRHLRSPSDRRSAEKHYDNVADAARKIYHDEGGLGAFYAGVAQDTIKTVTDAFLFFLAYNYLRSRRLTTKGTTKTNTLPVVDELTVGFVAGSFAKLLTSPIANIVTRKQTSGLVSSETSPQLDSSSTSTEAIARQIYAEKGVFGFWSGYSASLILTLNPTLTFFLYETFKRILLPRSRRDNPPPSATFILAAVSKAIASSVTYPFSLAKTRAQAVAMKSRPPSSSSSPSSHNNPESEPSKPSDNDSPSFSSFSSPSHNEHTDPNPFTIFYTLHTLYRADGLGALYAGLPAEISKGIFSHGFTMLIKESIHRSIINAYLLVSRVLASRTAAATSYLSAAKLAAEVEEAVAKASKTLADRTAGIGTTPATGVVRMVKTGDVAGARAAAEEAENGVKEWVAERGWDMADLMRDYVGNGEEGDYDGEWEWLDGWSWWSGHKGGGHGS